MANGEDPFTNLLGGLLAFGLVAWGVCWVLKKAWEAFVENLPVIVGLVACVALVWGFVAFCKAQAKLAADRKAFMEQAGAGLDALEKEMERQCEVLGRGDWERETAKLEKELAANG